jgi:hypothetical protein
MSSGDLLHDALPQLTRDWQGVPKDRRRDVVGLVFARELAEARALEDPTAVPLAETYILRRGSLVVLDMNAWASRPSLA